jgi:hypothetical protein
VGWWRRKETKIKKKLTGQRLSINFRSIGLTAVAFEAGKLVTIQAPDY